MSNAWDGVISLTPSLGKPVVEQSIALTAAGGTSQQVAISTTSAQSTAIAAMEAYIYSTVDTFMRQGSNPTAVNDGTDRFIPANVLLRLAGLVPGNKLAFKTVSGTGLVYITPEVLY